jgi:hypothetical protein
LTPARRTKQSVNASSIFLRGDFVVRKITSKEKRQILDKWEDWTGWAGTLFWNIDSPCIPCRIPWELVITATDWLPIGKQR